jgi:phosphoribosylaminoimidazolecarboxamide formyltransferase/IMP cyclohydrolase
MATALLSVCDKTGVVEFARELKSLGYNIISSGGTAKTLKENSVECTEISDVTGFPEMLDGRVKTLNPKIHGGILARRDIPQHIEELKKYNIEQIDIVAVNLYPFEETAKKIQKPENKKISQDIIENIDIGGVTLIRAGAKNYKDVLIVCSPCDYSMIIENLKNKTINDDLRLNLAGKAFRHTAYYDAMISGYLSYEDFPSQGAIPLKKLASLRYGENPHQKASLYSFGNEENTCSAISAKQIHGKELSYNNYLDLESAWRLVHEFDNTACAIIKHNNPCGCAEGSNVKDAYLKALSCDPVSAYGGIVAFNVIVEKSVAEELAKLFVECIIAPDFTSEATEILFTKKNIRLLKQPNKYVKPASSIEYRMLTNGMLVQERDEQLLSEIKTITKREPTQEEKDALEFAWKVCKHVKSNAIILVRGRQTVGIGAGQMSRIDSLNIAVKKMKTINHGLDESKYPLVLASDAFFPFPDVVEGSSAEGVTAIIQPGGSIRDDLSINACNERNLTMQFTSMRHFKH